MVDERANNQENLQNRELERTILDKTKGESTLVFGASLKPIRYSNIVIHRLRSSNYVCIGMGLRKGMVRDVSILTFDQEVHNIHTITMYLGANRQEEYIDQILSYNPKRIIFNPGAENLKLFQLAEERGIQVENACTLVLLSLNTY